MTKEAILTIGVSASGKSTWAFNEQSRQRALGQECVTIERDRFRRAIYVNKNMGEQFKWNFWNWKWENEVNELQDAALKEVIRAGANVIISDTNLNPKTREALTKRLEDAGFVVKHQVFDISFEDAVKRDINRDYPVGAFVIAKQMQQFQEQFGEKLVVMDPTLPKAAIVDIDGTVALMNGRKPYDWMRVIEDLPHEPVVDMVHGLAAGGHKILFTSGRDSVCRLATETWLNTVFGSIDFHLFMRPADDMRKDSIIKRELFEEHIEPFYNVKVVLDDRPQVTDLWRSMGLNVVQIGNPYVRF
jgi:predicted kinase